MADLTDVTDAFASLIAGALYPNGTGQPSAVAAPVRIYPGWPSAANLDADLRAGTVNVSIFPMDTESNTTRHTREWVELSRNEKTLTATVAGFQITFGGTVTLPMSVTVFARGRKFTYACQAGDTPSTVAAALAALINPTYSAVAAGAVLTLSGSWHIKCNVGVIGTVARVLRLQTKRFMISVWSPTPTLRSAVARIVDPVLSAPGYLALADHTNGRLTYVMSRESDDEQPGLLYRRDIIFAVEYPTIQTQAAYEITAIEENITGGVFPDDDEPHQINYGG